MDSSRHLRSAPGLARLLLAVFAVVWAGPLVHEATTRHVVCEEHASACHDEGPERTHVEHEGPHQAAWQAQEPVPADEGDDHGPCHVALTRAGQSLVPDAGPLVDLGSWTPPVPAVLAAEAACTVALLRMAPKTSPPLVA